MKPSVFNLCRLLAVILIICCCNKAALAKDDKSNVIPSSSLQAVFYNLTNPYMSLWFIKDSNRYMGLIVTGRAEKALCNQTYIDYYAKLKAVGDTNAVFLFGIAYTLKQPQQWTVAYNAVLDSMHNQFVEMQTTYQGQVKVDYINYSEYIASTQFIKNQATQTLQTKKKSAYEVNYKVDKNPLIVPYYYPQTGNVMQFTANKELFGNLVIEMIPLSYYKAIKQGLEKDIKINKSVETWADTLKCEFVIPMKTPVPFINKEMEREVDTLVTYRVMALLSASRSDTLFLKEAIKQYRQNKNNFVDTIRPYFEDWEKNSQQYIDKFEKDKAALIAKVKYNRTKLEEHLGGFNLLSNEPNHSLDAFLRGWEVTTINENMTAKYKSWYSTDRGWTWEELLTQIPNSAVEGKISGIFDTPNVFFKVEVSGDNFIITPYKVLGGEFTQTVSPKENISFY